nr:hypothetical protein [Tanacetum cinerariifolium]
TDTESELFKDDARITESPHIIAPPTCHVEELEGFGTSDATSLDSTAPLSPDHPLTHTKPVLVPILRRTVRMAMRVLLVMSPGLSVGMVEVEAMSDSAFCKRFRSSYDSSPSPTLPIKKRYRGTSKLILGTDSEEDEEVEESLDSDSQSKDVEYEGPTAEDEDPTVEDEDDESHGLDDESYGIDGEGCGIESDELGLGEEEAILEGQQRAVPVVGTAMSGLLPISPSPSVVPSHVSSPMIPLTVPSPIASPMATLAATISVDEDQFTKVGAQLEIYRGILQDHTQRFDAMPPTLFVEIDRDVRELHTRSGAIRDEIFS